MRRPEWRPLRRFLANQDALGTIEFAFIVPIVVLLMLGGLETARFSRGTQRVEMVANSIGEMLSQSPPVGGAAVAGDGLVTGGQLHFFYDSSMYTLPDASDEATLHGGAWWDYLDVAMWSVEFKPTSSGCGASCTYKPTVVWSFNGGPACNAQIQQVADTAIVSPMTLPASVYGPDSVLVVQVRYKFIPSLGAAFVGSTTITRTAILSPRNVPLVESADYAEGAGNCPGTP